MYCEEGFAELYPIQTEGAIMDEVPSINMQEVLPHLPGDRSYFIDFTNSLKPVAFTNWRDESLSWHYTCIIHAGLNPTPATIITGPDAKEFVKRAFVNKIDKFPIGSSKHGIMCTPDGNVAAQGVLMRNAENEYEASWVSPWIDYVRSTMPELDVTLTDSGSKTFVFQIQGPRSLEMVEDACKEDLHDIGFCRYRNAFIEGIEVRIFRFGMAGVLGYEVQGPIEASHKVYMALIEAGKPYGLRRMGSMSYDLNHTPGGNVQIVTHFFSSADTIPEFRRFLAQAYGMEGEMTMNLGMEGSLCETLEERLANPIEIGLEKIIDFDNPAFIGHDAIVAYREQAKQRRLVTLRWNPEDVIDIYASQFRPEEPYFQMDVPCESEDRGGVIMMDKVLDDDGNHVGFSSGRCMLTFERAMVSLAIMDAELCEKGTQVNILWGFKGSRQKLVRATVDRFPFNTHIDNRTFDVETIPHYADRH